MRWAVWGGQTPAMAAAVSWLCVEELVLTAGLSGDTEAKAGPVLEGFSVARPALGAGGEARAAGAALAEVFEVEGAGFVGQLVDDHGGPVGGIFAAEEAITDPHPSSQQEHGVGIGFAAPTPLATRESHARAEHPDDAVDLPLRLPQLAPGRAAVFSAEGCVDPAANAPREHLCAAPIPDDHPHLASAAAADLDAP